MTESNNSINKLNRSTLKAIMYFALFLIVLGLGNIVFGNSRVQAYIEVASKLEALKIDRNQDGAPLREPMTRLEEERLNTGIKRANSKLEFYRFVVLGGKSLLVISALLILTCFYYSKEFERRSD